MITKNKVEEFIRVDHAGERGAVKIYEGQLLALNTIVKNEDLDQIRWLEGTTPISKEDIQTKYDELVSAYNNDYKIKRKAEYPSIEELVVALYLIS